MSSPSADDSPALTRCAAMATSAVLIAALTVASLPLAYAHPVYDDFTRGGHAVRHDGVVASFVREYLNWSGRWASMVVEYAVQSLDAFRQFYGVFVGAVDLLFLAATAFAARSIAPELVSRVGAFVVASLVFALLWAGSPSAAEAFYWHTGGVENLMPFASLMLVVGAMARVARRGTTPSPAVTGGLALLAAVSTGYHELWGAAIVGILSFVALGVWRARSPARGAFALIAIVALLALIPNVLSPGNTARAQMEEIRARIGEARRFGRIAALVRDQLRPLASAWICDVRIAAAGIGIFLLVRGARATPTWLRWNGLTIAAAVFAWAGIIVSALIVATWAIARAAPLRTHNGLFVVYVLGLCLFIAVLASRGAEVRARTSRRFRCLGWALVGIAAALCLVSGNGATVLEELRSGILRRYDDAQRERHAVLSSAAVSGKRSVRVPPLPVLPRCYYPFDLDAAPVGGVNLLTAAWYGLDDVALDAPEPAGGTTK